MLHTTELDMAESVATSDVDAFLRNTAWTTISTYHIVLKASAGAAIFRRDMHFYILYINGLKKIGE